VISIIAPLARVGGDSPGSKHHRLRIALKDVMTKADVVSQPIFTIGNKAK
jgi:hypothetical protein